MDQNIDFLQIKRGNPNLNNPIIQELFFTYDAQVKPFNLQFNFNYTILKNKYLLGIIILKITNL